MVVGKYGRFIAFLALIVSACGQPGEPSAAGDGVLDCAEGEIERGGGIFVAGSSEEEVVSAALEEWVAQGAEVIRSHPDESWSAVLDGQEVAIAVPEQNGDGTWVVHAVSVCGAPEQGPADIDGSLDCQNDAHWLMQAGFAPDVIGDPTAEESVLEVIQPVSYTHLTLPTIYSV